jgi:hypothetical protein
MISRFVSDTLVQCRHQGCQRFLVVSRSAPSRESTTTRTNEGFVHFIMRVLNPRVLLASDSQAFKLLSAQHQEPGFTACIKFTFLESSSQKDSAFLSC